MCFVALLFFSFFKLAHSNTELLTQNCKVNPTKNNLNEIEQQNYQLSHENQNILTIIISYYEHTKHDLSPTQNQLSFLNLN